MKSRYTILITISAALLLLFAGCNTINPSSEELSEEEIEMAGVIIAESLSEERGGFIHSLYDAFSEVSEDRIRYQESSNVTAKTTENNSTDDTGRGSESEYNAQYNPETGEHIIAFRRSFQGPFVTKTLSVLNKYIFTDLDGEFLQYPRRQSSQIETIDFKGMKSGTVSTERRSSSFSRTDTLFTTGVSSASSILSLEGNHHGEGEMTANLRRANQITQRSYRVQFEFQNVQVDKEIVKENGNLEEGITGIISYRLHMQSRTNGESRESHVSGIVELTGDGTALMRFDRIQKTFQIALRNGTINL